MPVDYKLYHPKWSLISYLVRVKRANNCCEWSDAKHGESHPVTGSKVFLSVAHINQDRRLNQFWNLAALCQRCHLSHDRKQHIFNRKYGRLTKYVCGKLFEVPYLPKDVKEYRKNHYLSGYTLAIIEKKRRSHLRINNHRLFNTEISLKKGSFLDADKATFPTSLIRKEMTDIRSEIIY